LRFYIKMFGLLVCVALLYQGAYASDWASSVVEWSNLGISPYDDPLSVLGKPTTLIYDSPSTIRCSMVYPAQKTAPDGSKLATTILDLGYIIAEFDLPVFDDPQNWYGKDFIVFGNPFFTGKNNELVGADTNMEVFTIKNGTEGSWEPMTVSVSQDGEAWYTYTSGPNADDFAPTQAYGWDWVEHTWGTELDFTRPVDPALTKNSFAGKPVATAIDMYKGSGGGTAFDLAGLPLSPDPQTDRKWIRYVKVTANIKDKYGFIYRGELDAFARVGHAIAPISIGEAKKQPDDTRVILKEAVVSAATFEVGRCCYVEHRDRSGGIRVLGRTLNRGQAVVLHGVMDTVDGERVLRTTAMEAGQIPADPGALTMTGKAVHGTGLDTAGLLVRVFGQVKSVNETAKSFVIGDGSGDDVTCLAPRDLGNGVDPDPDFVPPSVESYVTATGISSREQSVPVLRLRDGTDLQPVPK